MGANIKQIKSRIKSVDSTLHITKAMQLVASSKVRRAQVAAAGGTAYAEAMRESFLTMVSGDTASSVFVTPPRSAFPAISSLRATAGWQAAITAISSAFWRRRPPIPMPSFCPSANAHGIIATAVG